jgi:DNA-binding MarR family transcriptional regulator
MSGTLIQREDAVEHVASTLLPQASLLARLVAKQACWTLTRSEGSVLSTLTEAPQRITALADLEGLAQPTVTIMVKRLEERGWVARDRDGCDGRVVLVSITREGREALECFREQYRCLLREQMARMDDAQIAELVRATSALAGMVEAFQDSAGSG